MNISTQKFTPIDKKHKPINIPRDFTISVTVDRERQMVVKYPSSYQAYKYVVDGETVIVKHHRVFNYSRLPYGHNIRRGVLSVLLLGGFAGTFLLTDLVHVFFMNDPPESYSKENQAAALKRRKQIGEYPLQYHRVGQPVKPDPII